MTDFQFHVFALPLVYAPIAYGIYASIAYYRQIRVTNIDTWKKTSMLTNLSPNEFIQRAQNLCANKGYLLIDINATPDVIKVVIKENPSLIWWFGQMYYIEYKAAEPQEIDLYARGCVFKQNLNISSYNNTLNAFVKL